MTVGGLNRFVRTNTFVWDPRTPHSTRRLGRQLRVNGVQLVEIRPASTVRLVSPAVRVKQLVMPLVRSASLSVTSGGTSFVVNLNPTGVTNITR